MSRPVLFAQCRFHNSPEASAFPSLTTIMLVVMALKEFVARYSMQRIPPSSLMAFTKSKDAGFFMLALTARKIITAS